MYYPVRLVGYPMRRGLQIQNLASFVPLTQKQQRGGGIEKERIRQIFADLFANRFSTIAFQTPANHHPPQKTNSLLLPQHFEQANKGTDKDSLGKQWLPTRNSSGPRSLALSLKSPTATLTLIQSVWVRSGWFALPQIPTLANPSPSRRS